ncbi:hypothetical protein A0J61_10345 [Choanephora cucurbitarum]|uniref:Endonuclease/exonuclease/phosphatase domain-containing protein n=1 Tax=Choanephora cucurbitarum TaxID=101091 RepID=A0A1C7MYX3_9FUNG|nr:hypothetical protein A0J61_10345 [Choanephora cucurbitarum]
MFVPFFVMVVYVTASSGRARKASFNHLLDSLFIPSMDIDLVCLINAGDSNYSHLRANLLSSTSERWVSFLEERFVDILRTFGLHELLTFRRNTSTSSTIDYIFASSDFTSPLSRQIYRLSTLSGLTTHF